MAGPTLMLLGLFAGVATAGKGGLLAPPGGDDVGSMPDAAAEDDPSFMLLASLADLDAVLLSVKGTGTLSMRPIAPGSDRVLVELEGSLSIALDPRVLASGRVRTLFGVGTTFAGGSADVYAHGKWSTVDELAPLSVRELPLAFLAGDVSPTLIHADALGGEVFGLVSSMVDGAVVVRQSVH